MAQINSLLLSQIAGYIISLILSICIIIPMSFHQDEFRGHCLLFSTGEWEVSGQFKVNWAPQSYCNFTIFVGVLSSVISIIQIYRLSTYAYKGIDSSFLSAFIDVIICFVLFLCTISAASMITSGFMVWCKGMMERFPSCETAAGQAIDKDDGIDTTGFYIELGTAQFGAWASWACWVGLNVFAVLKLCRYHQLENMRVSMFKERQRLIKEGTRSEKISKDKNSKLSSTSSGN